jgi:hypothetical protein
VTVESGGSCLCHKLAPFKPDPFLGSGAHVNTEILVPVKQEA